MSEYHQFLATPLGLLFVAMVMLASVLGPCNAVTANVVPSNQRAAGYALSIFLIHLLGDISSPILIGTVSDLFGDPSLASSAIGELLASLGAKPVRDSNLIVGMLSVVPVMILGGLFFFGSRQPPEDQARSRQSSSDDSTALFLGHRPFASRPVARMGTTPDSTSGVTSYQDPPSDGASRDLDRRANVAGPVRHQTNGHLMGWQRGLNRRLISSPFTT